MGDVHAEHAPEHAPEGLVDPAVAWGALGAHVVNAKGTRVALEWLAVSVRISPTSHASCWQLASLTTLHGDLGAGVRAAPRCEGRAQPRAWRRRLPQRPHVDVRCC